MEMKTAKMIRKETKNFKNSINCSIRKIRKKGFAKTTSSIQKPGISWPSLNFVTTLCTLKNK